LGDLRVGHIDRKAQRLNGSRCHRRCVGIDRGEPFSALMVSPSTQQALNCLSALERNRLATNLAVSSLAQAGVIKPWPITIKSEQGDRTVGGLNCIDEAALNGLPKISYNCGRPGHCPSPMLSYCR
jgi:hypothetical protein